MNKFVNTTSLIKVTLLILIAASNLVLAGQDSSTSTILYFEEKEAGVEPFESRFIVNDRYLRIDSGKESDNFILFDSSINTVFNVTHTEQTVLVLKPKSNEISASLKKRLDQLQTSVVINKDEHAPKIAGIQPKELLIKTQDTLCARVSIVEGLMPDVLKTLLRYQDRLTENNLNNLSHTPEAYVSSCMLVNDVKHASAYLEHGFPIFWNKGNTNSRLLISYKEKQSLPEKLFQLPESYEQYSPFEKPAKQ